ncbi:hypothetical protein GCM10023142_17170 [Anaerocolumna aminovalerica]|jgi:hypothetical protein|uniref:Carbohydrate-binding family 9 n=1 Tax=Anaerocolumna aminovalerica TaxID=1527 RepID=A0A1I5C8A1_9FIRM|nr:carbohydrate-binding family 9-like protein [Anaerocolumna aminovalerica]SFN83233.1 Carbohydrate-binding family 9 [Anaerocolumna aminovalerica]
MDHTTTTDFNTNINHTASISFNRDTDPVYPVLTIESSEQLNQCPKFLIDQYKWPREREVQAYGQMALLKDYGLLVSMTAIEDNPLTTYTEDNDPVYKDSAMEAFLNFAAEDLGIGYFNFEMNSYGAMLSGFGPVGNRKRVKEITELRAVCTAKKEKDSWSILLKIPMELICDVYKIPSLKPGDQFTCNFYKISEDPSIEHYGSFAPITNPKPNFHLPQFFANAKIM